MPDAAFDQSTYQVRFEWGVDGIARLAPSDVVVVVDVLSFSSRVVSALDDGATVALDESAHAVSTNGAPVSEAAAASGALVMLGALSNATAVARAILAEQTSNARRTSIAVIAAGERERRADDAPLRFAVEDLLGGGAVIAALTDLGIDHTSPEAAAAAESFRALKGAARHLIAASGTGRALGAEGRRDDVLASAALDGSDAVPVLRHGVFVAY